MSAFAIPALTDLARHRLRHQLALEEISRERGRWGRVPIYGPPLGDRPVKASRPAAPCWRCGSAGFCGHHGRDVADGAMAEVAV